MTYMKKTLNATKDKIKQQLMSFFKTPNAKHLAAKNLNTTAQKLTETVREYDKIFKYLLSQLEYIIDEKLLFQWFCCWTSTETLDAYLVGQLQHL